MTDTQAEAVRSTRTGAVILLTDRNRKKLLARHDMVSTVAVRDKDTGAWKDVNANESVGNVVSSASLNRIADTIAGIDSQRAQLVSAALKLDGGAAYLKQQGIVFEDTSVAETPKPDFKAEETSTEETTSRRRSRRSRRNSSDTTEANAE